MPMMIQSRVGQAAVAFALPDLHGQAHRLEDQAGRWRLLVFHRHLG